MREFSVLTAPFYAFFSRSLYADVAHRWRGATFAYLLLLLALCWLPFMVSFSFGLLRVVSDDALIEQIPPISIERGRVSADVEQPYRIRYSRGSFEFYAIIDTTGEVTSLDDTSANILLTSFELFVKRNETETRVYDLSGVRHFYVDGPTAERWLRRFATWGAVLIYPLFVGGSYVYRLLQALFYSLIGLLIAKVLERPLSYPAILRVTVMAITPAVLIKTIVQLTALSLPVAWLFYFTIAMVYLVLGISFTAEGPPAESGERPAEAG